MRSKPSGEHNRDVIVETPPPCTACVPGTEAPSWGGLAHPCSPRGSRVPSHFTGDPAEVHTRPGPYSYS